ncbi:MAG TPA: hypothetical protein VGK87_04215 [Anaerolineae bacterium]|jgi:hypothetical protein
MNPVSSAIALALRDIEPFSRLILKRPLRAYQLEPARAAIQSVIARDGEQYLWRFPRQSGKNETLAHVHAYLLFLFQRVKGASIVHTAPTFDPQARNAMLRVLEITSGSPFFANLKSAGNCLTMGRARAIFLSGAERDRPNVGSTASLLLSKDECQDLSQRYIEQAFDPMTASSNAPHIHTGTARHDGTYLALKRRELEEFTRRDGRRRVFIIDWHDVAQVNPAYGRAVEAAIERKGALHPMILTEYVNIETEQTGRLFDERRMALVFAGSPPRQLTPDGRRACITIDVGGATIDGPHYGDYEAPPGIKAGAGQHDMTVATVHLIDADSAGLNRFYTVDQLTLAGANVLDDTADRRRLLAYIELWQPVRVVVDATGLGIGLASALSARYRDRVTPFTFTAATKTALLNDFLALIETGRYHHYRDEGVDALRFVRQLEKCEHAYRGALMKWGVPAHVAWRHPVTGTEEPLHDDHLVSAALVAVLAESNLRPREVTSTASLRRTSSRMDEA